MSAPSIEIDPNDHCKGTKSPAVTFIHYADYRCPYSGDAYPVIERTLEQFEGKILFIYRHFPLVHLHPQALLLSKFAEAAGEQGHFWEAHDLLFRAQRSLTNERLQEFVMSHKLDAAKFASAIDSERVRLKIENDLIKGKASGVQKTPSFVINGSLYQNEWHDSGFRDELSALLS